MEIKDETGVVQLPVKRRQDTKGLMLVPPEPSGCSHLMTAFTVDVKAGKCACRGCGQEVSPMFVLERLMQKESQWQRTREAYQGEMQRLGERTKTKCQHCKKMTRVSNR